MHWFWSWHFTDKPYSCCYAVQKLILGADSQDNLLLCCSHMAYTDLVMKCIMQLFSIKTPMESPASAKVISHAILSRLMTKPLKWHVRPAKTQISLGIRPVWSESSLSAWRKLGSLAIHWAQSEDSDKTGRIRRLMWVFAGRTVILLALSWGSSYLGQQGEEHTVNILKIRTSETFAVITLKFEQQALPYSNASKSCR